MKSNCGRTEFLCFRDSIKQDLSSELDVTHRLVENEEQDHAEEEKNTESGHKDTHPAVETIEGHSKSKQFVEKTDIKEGSEEIITPIKTKQNGIVKTNSRIVGGDMTENKDLKQFQSNSRNIKNISLSKNMGKTQNHNGNAQHIGEMHKPMLEIREMHKTIWEMHKPT